MRLAATGEVQTGLAVLRRQGFAPLRGLRLGLVCNHTSLDSDRRHLLDLALAAGLQVAALFSPEHGLAGVADTPVASAVHEPTGLPVHSLYGSAHCPTPEMLAGLDALVYDIADVGVRYYTYTTTMTHCLQAAGEAGLGFWVLDRPNPLRGDRVEGPVLDRPGWKLSAWHPLPLRHGLTSGELATWAQAFYNWPGELQVVRCEGWQRSQWGHETGLGWVNPSPNLRHPRQVALYPAVGPLETCDLSVGRGTDLPFEVIGAPWLDGRQLAQELNQAGISELGFVPVEFTPQTREFAGWRCEGVTLVPGDWDLMQPVTAAVQIALTLRRLWPEHFDPAPMHHLLGSQAAVEAICRGDEAESIVATWQPELAAVAAELRRFWLYLF
jgi:uncharacterized protein YbbC (DUF1343 family)